MKERDPSEERENFSYKTREEIKKYGGLELEGFRPSYEEREKYFFYLLVPKDLPKIEVKRDGASIGDGALWRWCIWEVFLSGGDNAVVYD